MDGATSCSWVCVCQCANVHCYKHSQRFTTFLTNSHMFFTQKTFDMPNNASNTTESQHRKHFMVRNDEKVRRRVYSTYDVNKATLLSMLRVSVLLYSSKASTSSSFMSLVFTAVDLAISPPFPAGSKVLIYASTRVHVDSMSIGGDNYFLEK